MLVLTMLGALAAHEGEEFAIILPAVMLVGAFFVLRWANQNDKARSDEAEAEAEAEAEDQARSGKMPIEPPHEAQPADDPDRHHRQVHLTGERLPEREHDERDGEDAEDEQDEFDPIQTVRRWGRF